MRLQHRVPGRFGILLEASGFERRIGRRRSKPRVVDEDRRRPELLRNGGHCGVDRGPVRGIDGMDRHRSFVRDQLRDARARAFRQVEGGHRGAGVGERGDVPAAEPASRTGHEGDLPEEGAARGHEAARAGP